MNDDEKKRAYSLLRPIADPEAEVRLKVLSEEHDAVPPELREEWRANLALLLPSLFVEWLASRGESVPA